MDPKILANILVISTVGKDTTVGDGKETRLDLFQTLETDIILAMKTMLLSDLINLLWTAQEIGRGSPYFYDKLESEITLRIKGIKDEDFQTLIECFSEGECQSKFSEKFMSIILDVVKDKKERFQMKTIVHMIWALARLDFTSERVMDLLIDLREYPRLNSQMDQLYQKSQAILLWTYSRDERICTKEFILKVVKALCVYQGPKFDLENFDLLLIIQSIMHLERGFLKDDIEFMN